MYKETGCIILAGGDSHAGEEDVLDKRADCHVDRYRALLRGRWHSVDLKRRVAGYRIGLSRK